MDNVTHSLAGLVVAEAAARLRPPPRDGGPGAAGVRAAAPLLGAVAANLPDADVLWSAVAHDKLGSLLHHRGYTHTVAAALLGALLVWGVALLVARRRGPRAPGDAAWLLAVAAAGVASHLALDWTNDYGVHVLTPFDNRWRYGDGVFIVEPWLWVAAAPPLLFAARRRAVRVAFALVLAAGLALAWAVPLVARGAAVVLTAGAAVSLLLASRLAPGPRIAAAVAGWLLVESAFFAGTGAVRANVRAAQRMDPAATLVDAVVTPAPANPLCARVIAVERVGDRARGDRYRLSVAWGAAAPSLLPVARCETRGTLGTPSLPMRPASRAGTAAVRWVRAWDAPLAELAALARDNCHVAAVLRFTRAPFWYAAGDDTLYVGDLRYDREPGVAFAEFRVPAVATAGQCPRDVPPWRPPRADLLGAAGE